eukprot:927920_1
MRKADVVVKNETKIIDYFTTNNINGQHMMNVPRKTFVYSLLTFVGDKKLTGKACAIWKALKEYDPLKEKKESLKRLCNDAAILSRLRAPQEDYQYDVYPSFTPILSRLRGVEAPIVFARFLMDCYNVFRDKLDDKGQYDKKSFPKHK